MSSPEADKILALEASLTAEKKLHKEGVEARDRALETLRQEKASLIGRLRREDESLASGAIQRQVEVGGIQSFRAAVDDIDNGRAKEVVFGFRVEGKELRVNVRVIE